MAGDNLGYQCFSPPPANSVAVCGSCDNMATSCAPGETCFSTSQTSGHCARYCCTNADCGTGVCDLTLTIAPNGGGLCTAGPTDAGTADAAATDAAAPAFQCTGIPATPPSTGTCITWSPATDAGM
jgi:hypothetical protein